jgi:hypothetical protein
MPGASLWPTLQNPAESKLSSGRTLADLIACVGSVVGALALVIFLFLPATPATGPRLYISLFLAPVARMIGYWVMYDRLRGVRPIWAELGFYPLILGSLFLVAQTALKVSASLNLSALAYSTHEVFDLLLKSLVALMLPLGLAIYACLIWATPPLRRWLALMMIPQAALLTVTFGSFGLPCLGEFGTSRVLVVYTIVLMFAKAVWFLSPVAVSKTR